MDRPLEKELPVKLYRYFQENTMTGVASTVDEEGFPHGAPMSMFYALDPGTMLMAVQNGSVTFLNACRSGRIALTFISGGDLAVTIQARVQVLRENMENSKYMGILYLELQNVRSNVAQDVEIKEGLELVFRSQRWREYIGWILGELHSYTRGSNGELIKGESNNHGGWI
jgi:hypothetical protein